MSDTASGRAALGGRLQRLREHLPTLVGLVLALFGVWLVTPVVWIVGSATGLLSDPVPELVNAVAKWLVAAGVLVVVVAWEDRPPASMGIVRPSLADVGWGVAGAVVGIAWYRVSDEVVEWLGFESATAAAAWLAELSVPVLFVVTVTAVVTEELLFRGYPIERLTELTGDVRLGATVAIVLFTIGHLPVWGPAGAVQIGVWSILVTAIYVRRRSVAACILVHFLNHVYLVWLVLTGAVG
jgi:membrane protease YdiL (CAAX protease family)